jgi:hypothetical protein
MKAIDAIDDVESCRPCEKGRSSVSLRSEVVAPGVVSDMSLRSTRGLSLLQYEFSDNTLLQDQYEVVDSDSTSLPSAPSIDQTGLVPKSWL